MKKNLHLFALVIALAFILTGCATKETEENITDKSENTEQAQEETKKQEISEKAQMPTPVVPIPEVINANAEKNNTTENGQVVKEFTMTSFTEIIDGKYFPQYSIKEITVNKGDLVRLKVTVTKGTHDIKIDEFNVFAETPLNEEVAVEFTADKVGEFIYWCTKPGHRENGHWGTLKVIE